MIDSIKKIILGTELSNQEDLKTGNDKRVQIATCALFLELANSDDNFSIEEKGFIDRIMKQLFGLDDQTVTELVELSIQQTEKSVSIYEFTEIINQNFNDSEKYDVLKNLWRLIFSDGKLDMYEEYFIRKISGNLKLQHSDMIAAKMEVKAEQKK